MKLHKIKFKKSGKEGVILDYTKGEANNETKTVNSHSTRAPQLELVDAMNAFKPHFLALTDMEVISKMTFDEKEKRRTQNYTKDIFENYVVSGVTVRGEGDSKLIIITGGKKTGRGRVFYTNTPAELLVSESYQWIAELKEALENLEKHAEQYNNGKAGNKEQIVLFTSEPDEQKDDKVAV